MGRRLLENLIEGPLILLAVKRSFLKGFAFLELILLQCWLGLLRVWIPITLHVELKKSQFKSEK